METGITTGPEKKKHTFLFYPEFSPLPLCPNSCQESGQSDARQTCRFSSRHNKNDGWVREVRPQGGVLGPLQDLKKSFCVVVDGVLFFCVCVLFFCVLGGGGGGGEIASHIHVGHLFRNMHPSITTDLSLSLSYALVRPACSSC